jgi:hypothetical protein
MLIEMRSRIGCGLGGMSGGLLRGLFGRLGLSGVGWKVSSSTWLRMGHGRMRLSISDGSQDVVCLPWEYVVPTCRRVLGKVLGATWSGPSLLFTNSFFSRAGSSKYLSLNKWSPSVIMTSVISTTTALLNKKSWASSC